MPRYREIEIVIVRDEPDRIDYLPRRHDPESCGQLREQAGNWWLVLIPICLGIIALVVVLGWVGW
jgi:hypothetical protein